MTVHQKIVTRYEVVCDRCGGYLGEHGDPGNAHQAQRRHDAACRPAPTKCTNCGTTYGACTNRIRHRRLSACCDECTEYDCHGLKEAGLL
jgi:hypothetical protein